uniref:AB hydrolase-1 domain-containing protein n=1 Tax=Odontella aurita TaxID=265563 RepID=A0A7S4N9I3_9STRA|mmetsp:Transcript_53498/g.160087  ORF Transcript_53498/g.160087 Transcript_53498/m.160087 type:complete len:402 (+) Transcript_53498:95-1300(+)
MTKSTTAAGLATLAALSASSVASAFIPPSASTSIPSAVSAAATASVGEAMQDLTFSPPDTMGAGEITEVACAEAASRMKRVAAPVPTYVSPSGSVGVSYIHWPADPSAARERGSTLPVLLVHGFDSSCLEYRRLGPKLAAQGVDVYAVDLLGWGYSQLDDVSTFSAQAKVDALAGFWEAVGGNKPVCIGGASLGGAAAIEFGAANPDVVKGAVFIDAQGFVDGVGPMASLPKPLAQLGVKVLKSVPLRNSANQMSYYDPETYATEDALKVGRFHCLRDGWDDALVSFMLSGGFSPSTKVEKIEAPSLVLWGRQDGILEKEFADKFIDTLPDGELRWVEECGHVPHLEQPEVTAEAIAGFLRSEKFEGVGGTEVAFEAVPTAVWGVGGLAGAAALAGAAFMN